MEALRAALAAHLADTLGGDVQLSSVERLSGGACQENLRLKGQGLGGPLDLVFRLDAVTALPGSLNRVAEARVVNAAVAAGVTTPEARWLLRLPDERAGYFMDYREGVAIGRQVVDHPSLAAARAELPARLGAELARIHAVPLAAALDGVPPAEPAAAALETLRTLLGQRHEPLLAFRLVVEWLAAHRPASGPAVLLHGDFRTGNFLVTPGGLSAILDWEFAHAGAREEDLAWISVRDWRFGRLERPVGGFGARQALYAAYEEASGAPVDRQAVHWWEVYGNARWGLGCLDQADRYRRGEARDVELLAIGRRWTEMAWEAMRLIEEGPAS